MTTLPDANAERQEALDRRDYLKRELEWFGKQLESVKRDQRRAPLLLLGVPLAIPAGLVFDAWIAFFVAAGTIILTTSAIYLTSGHRSEYHAKIGKLESELRDVERRIELGR
jgi:hypothetical protein